MEHTVRTRQDRLCEAIMVAGIGPLGDVSRRVRMELGHGGMITMFGTMIMNCAHGRFTGVATCETRSG